MDVQTSLVHSYMAEESEVILILRIFFFPVIDGSPSITHWEGRCLCLTSSFLDTFTEHSAECQTFPWQPQAWEVEYFLHHAQPAEACAQVRLWCLCSWHMTHCFQKCMALNYLQSVSFTLKACAHRVWGLTTRPNDHYHCWWICCWSINPPQSNQKWSTDIGTHRLTYYWHSLTGPILSDRFMWFAHE